MTHQLPNAGSVNDELSRDIDVWWQDAAEKTEIDLSEFDPYALLTQRLAWALRQGLEIGTVYSRFSSKRQHSTPDQVRTSVQHAAIKGIYCPPEFVCVDEAQRGYRARRAGLDRMLSILKHRYATVLLVFKASRLYRQAFKGYQLIQQEVVEEGLRAISVTQGIDTRDTKAWRMLFQVHGMVDDMLVEATADHVRASLKGMFARNYTVGALPVGYRRKDLSDAPVTNRGLTRTVPEIDRPSPDESGESTTEDSENEQDVAAMIVEHFELIRDGMPIKKGWRKWVADGGPADPRSTKGYMSYQAYRRMLSRIAYTGRWEFGRKRNEFSTKRDYSRQIEQPDSEVEMFQCEELRIVSDELFFAVQRKLAKLTWGPRGPRKTKDVHLWDFTTGMFHCGHCSKPDKPVRFYQTGANGKGMQCKNGDLCPCKSAVRRDEAVRAVCEKLTELINRDAELIEGVICQSRELDSHGDEELRQKITSLETKIRNLTHRIGDLYELSGVGSDEDRKEVTSKIRAVQTERASARADLVQWKEQLAGTLATLTSEDVGEILANFRQLLEDGAAGQLGEEAVHKAVEVFRLLTGGQIIVHVERRPGRKRTNVRGVFRPRLIEAVTEQSGHPGTSEETAAKDVTVWLRKPPRKDAIAERVHELIDIEGQSYREAAKTLQQEGHNVNSGNVWYSYRRWYEMQGQPVPDQPYNNGKPRKSR